MATRSASTCAGVGAKYQPLRAFAPAGDDHVVGMTIVLPHQREQVLWPVLAIAVHDANDIEGAAPVDFGQSGGNGPLMSKVAHEADQLDTADGVQIAKRLLWTGNRIGRAIVHRQHLDGGVRPGQRLIQFPDQDDERFPVVENRNDDCDAHGIPVRQNVYGIFFRRPTPIGGFSAESVSRWSSARADRGVQSCADADSRFTPMTRRIEKSAHRP